MDVLDRIEMNPEVCNGRPVVKGTRITVSTVLGFLSAGDSVDDILAGYPSLTRDDVLACLMYASRIAERHGLVRESV
jgi:uncharacterized protein (DUF433 family)